MGEKLKRPYEELLTDVLHEILIGFPVKTLCKFRCICKQWYSLISDPSFQQDHYRRSQQNPLLLITRCEFDNNAKTNTLHLTTYTNGGTLINSFSKIGLEQCLYYPIQSCRGLVCIAASYDVTPILVCNPSTEELIALPPTKGKHHCLGFGYSASTKEFKVVRFFLHSDENEDEYPETSQDTEVCCDVFVLGTNKWREARSPPIQYPVQYPPDYLMWGAPFLHGALHLVHIVDHDNKHPCIDVFDIETEVYTKIPFPEYYHTVKRLRGVFLKELQGSLCLTLHFKTCLEFLCLKDYHGREWVKEYSVDLTSLEPYVWIDPLQIMGDGRMMLNLEREDVKSLCYYDFQKKSFSEDEDTKDNCSGISYVESFSPLGR